MQLNNASLTCGFSRFGWSYDCQLDWHGGVGLALSQVFEGVEHEGVACLLGGEEVDVLVEDQRVGGVARALRWLDQISFCILQRDRMEGWSDLVQQ